MAERQALQSRSRRALLAFVPDGKARRGRIAQPHRANRQSDKDTAARLACRSGVGLVSAGKVQVLWQWKRRHAPAGEVIRWHFVAHGAQYDRGNAEEIAALMRSHGKRVRIIPI